MNIVKKYQNTLALQMMLGPANSLLKVLEEKQGVNIFCRGNELSFEAEDEKAKCVEKILDILYSKAKKGDVNEHDIDMAIAQASGTLPTEQEMEGLMLKTLKKQIVPRTKTQADFINAMKNHEMVFGIGPAGTGKTYLAVAQAVEQMLAGKIEKVILTRPAVEAGENLGFLPGDLKEKIDPYLRPLYDALYEMLPADMVAKKIAAGEIEIAPLAYMRGRTLSHSAIILDEAQNTTPMQMKMFLTRLGEGSVMVINGDLSQTDLPKGMTSGLAQAVDYLSGIEEISIIHFTEADVVRHNLITKIIKAYAKGQNNG